MTAPTTESPRPVTPVDYDTSWARSPLARTARRAVVGGPIRAAVALIAAPHRQGLDRLSGLDGPAIFASNHHSHLDAPLLLTSIPEPWRHRLVVAAAADYFFVNPAVAAVSALALGAVPIDRTKVNRRSADRLAHLLDDGWSLVIFPEGGRSPDGWGRHHRGGAAYLAARCGVPVVPIHVEGTDRIFAKGDKVPHPGRATVTFGRPLRPHPGESTTRLAARIEAAVAAIADEVTTDWWAARRRAAAGATPSLLGPEAAPWRRRWLLERRAHRARGAG